MRITLTTATVAIAAVMVGASDVAAQSAWMDRGYVNINGAYQSGDNRVTQSLSESVYGEDATYTLTQDVSSGAMFDVSFGGRVWRNLAAGLAISTFSSTGAIDMTGTVPHPLFFNRPRSVSGQVGGLDHNQAGYHVQFSWFVPVNDRFDVAVFGGPSFFNVDHTVATGVTVAEVGEPFDMATVGGIQTQALSESGTGGNVGIDVTYMLTDIFGAGVNLRWAGGTVDLPVAGGTQSIDAGGFQVGVGARVRF